jgi:hypothetical protein
MAKASSEKSEMSELTWASEVLQEHVAPKGSAQYVEGRIALAARALKWKFSRARTIWYADERASIKPRELRDVEEYTGLRYGREELRDVDRIISQADALLLGQDADFYSAFVAGLRAFIGALDRSRIAGGDK